MGMEYGNFRRTGHSALYLTRLVLSRHQNVGCPFLDGEEWGGQPTYRYKKLLLKNLGGCNFMLRVGCELSLYCDDLLYRPSETELSGKVNEVNLRLCANTAV